ncbi:alpha/beta hydrolase [Pseudomonas sp. SIMBA_077]
MNTWQFDERRNAVRWHDTSPAGTPLIYLHGLGCASSSDYPRVVASLEYLDARSWLVDLPGAGFSDKPNTLDYRSLAQASLLQEWISAQAISEVELFGHSAGAFIALKLAALAPCRVKRLILCAPGLNEYGVAFLQSITAMSQSDFEATGFDQLLTQLKEALSNDAWLGPLQTCSARAVYQWANSALEDNASDWLGALAVIPGHKGVILPDSATQQEIESYLQIGCRVELIANSGHMIAYDNPDELAAAISRLRGQ